MEWFAERVDRIILLFDAHKLDISDEFRRSIEALKGHDDKIRIVLNKGYYFEELIIITSSQKFTIINDKLMNSIPS